MDVRRFFIKPVIPAELERLHEMTMNVWSCWDQDALGLFHRLDPKLFREVSRNPVELLYRIQSSQLEKMSRDKGFLYELERTWQKFQMYMNYEGIFEEKALPADFTIAYICAEYGLHESLPIYSGGLAVLAGDTLKAASDMGIPMVSFGLLYRYGYFTQSINTNGEQTESFHENTWFLRPVQEVLINNAPLVIEIPLKNQKVFAKIWRIQVGRVPLYLLDTNIHQNHSELRNITNMLYDPDRRIRLEQELILGRGSIIAMRALNIHPNIYHLNEGHTAFTIIERFRELAKDFSYEEARHIIRNSTVFTTHTPVIEGNENFPSELIEEYLGFEIKAMGLNIEKFLSLGMSQKGKPFWLPAFAMKHARRSNGVSKLHASVTKQMWQKLFEEIHPREYPIEAITNSVHLPTWLSLQMVELFTSHIGPDYLHQADKEGLWEKIRNIPDGELWNAHRRRKEQVISFIRNRVSLTMTERGYCKKIRDIDQVLNPDHLTIGFARRFAPYKRADLILTSPERLAAIVANAKKPVQFVFAGKAHPADKAGKELIKKVFNFINHYPVENRVVFIENYDMSVARHIVQGVDVWLNTPRLLMEASGTSGIKAGINGVLNLSVLDGWWPEAYNGKNGWAVVSESRPENDEHARQVEAAHLYELIENEITDLYYDRTEGTIPIEWEKMMKESIFTICSGFNMHQNLRQYINKCYIPEIQTAQKFHENNYDLLRNTIKLRAKIDAIWSHVHIKDYFTNINGRPPVSGEVVRVETYVHLGDADEGLFEVQAFYSYGPDTGDWRTYNLPFVERYADKVAKYAGEFNLEGVGQQEVTVRLVPKDENLRELYPEYTKWKS